MNRSKTKVMMENDAPIYVNNTQIENVESYTYVGQRYSTRDKNQDKEIQRRITGRVDSIRQAPRHLQGTCLKRQVYNSCVLPAMTNGAETWALTSYAKIKPAAAQTKMERSMLKKNHIPGQKNKRLGKRKDKGHRRD